MTFYDSVLSNLKGVIGSRKDGVLLCDLDDEYQTMAGEGVPIKRLGYESIYEFVKCHSELFYIQGSGRFSRVINVVGDVENDATRTLIDLIQHTRNKKKGSGLKGFQNVRTNHLGYKTFSPSSYHSNQYKPYQPNIYKLTNTPYYANPYKLVNSQIYQSGYKSTKPLTIYQHPNTGIKMHNGTDKTINSSVSLASKTSEIQEVVVISDDDDEDLPVNKLCHATTQTPANLLTTDRRKCASLQAEELVSAIIEVILEYKSLKYNEILKIEIDGDLYYNFRSLTGLHVDPSIFHNDVVCAIESPQLQQLYSGLISMDKTKNYCLFNSESTFNREMSLPQYAFNYDKEYVVEIIKIIQNSLVVYKISTKYPANLNWNKTKVSEETQKIIENQPFCLWMPGSLCLVQMPESIVKKFKISTLERAVISVTRISSFQNQRHCLLHRTSFYLIDKNVDVNDILSCASSFQGMKHKVRLSDESDIAIVCNLSMSAKNTPPKIQFTRLNNFKSICKSFLDEKTKKLKPNSMIVLKNIRKLDKICHFQPLYVCSSLILELEGRILNNYNDIASYQDKMQKFDCQVSRRKVIVISDSENEDPVGSKSVTNSNSGPCKLPLPTFSEKVELTPSLKYSDYHNDISIIPHAPNKILESSYSDKVVRVLSSIPVEGFPIIESPKCCPHLDGIPDAPNKISKSLTYFENVLGTPCSNVAANNSNVIFSKYIQHNNGIIITPNNHGNLSCRQISILSSSKSDCNEELPHDSDLQDNTVSKINISSAMINYLENNSDQPRKCFIPLTVELIHLFNGRLVKLLHIQSGSAVLMIFDSVKFMRRDMGMLTLKSRGLQKAQKISVGDFLIWRHRDEDKDDYNVVEVMQHVSDTSVLVNKVHHGLLAVINVDELFCLPADALNTLIGPSVGAFDIHLLPDWFTPDDRLDFSNQLFTAFFTDDARLVLEYFEEPGTFLNLCLIESIEQSLAVNHSNDKSRYFITVLAKNLLQCRIFVGDLLQMIDFNNGVFNEYSLTKVLTKVNVGDRNDIWFASVLSTNDCCYEKLSPHNFMSGQFCIDRVRFDDRKHCLRLMDHSQNVYMDMPDNCDGLYKIDRTQISGSLKANEEFLTRYMLAGAAQIPDLNYLGNKLIF